MAKKITMACMALVALAAFALPATASATNDPQITHPTGTLLSTATLPKIVGTQVGGFTRLWDTENKNVELECTSATMTGELTKNSGGTVEGKITSAVFGGTGAKSATEPANECTATSIFTVNTSVTPQVSAAAPWCLRSTPTMVTDEFQVSSGTCGTNGKLKFILAPTGVEACTYESTGVVKGTYTTHPEDAILHIKPSQTTSGFKKISGSFICPSSGQLEMSFTLETDGTNQPLYIS